MNDFERVLVASDLRSDDVVEAGIDLARRLGARPSIVYALDRQTVEELREEIPGEGGYVDVLVARQRDALMDQVRRVAGSVPESARVEVLLGEPEEVVRRLAEEDDVGVVVIGRRQRSRVGKLLLGSVTQEILLGVAKPVVTIPT